MSYKRKTLSAADIIGKPEKKVEETVVEEPSFVKTSEGQGGGEVIQEAPVQSSAPIREQSNQREQYPYQNQTPTVPVSGILDIQPEGHGFLRPKFAPSQRDVYISQSQIRRFMLRPGDLIEGLGRPPKDTERYFGLLKVEKVNGMDAEA